MKRRLLSQPANIMSYIELYGDEVGFEPRRLPDAPTTTAPGTPARVAVMAARAITGHELWHPQDISYLGEHRCRDIIDELREMDITT